MLDSVRHSTLKNIISDIAVRREAVECFRNTGTQDMTSSGNVLLLLFDKSSLVSCSSLG